MKYIMIVIASIFLIGCGGTNESKKIRMETYESKKITMEIGKIYTVNEGDKLEKTSEDAEVIINKNAKTEITTVELTKGSTTITRGN